MATGEFSYDEQGKWPGVCVTSNKRQSPINIVAGDVKVGKDLMALKFSSAWAMDHEGEFINTGHTARLNPNYKAVDLTPTITTHLGTYELLQAHFHWGSESGKGTEHLVDGGSGELEIHFVNKKHGATDQSAGDFLTVIGVFADVDEHAPLTGPWLKLDVTTIQDFKATTPITGFRIDQLLPKNLGYYYYEGSLTTPPCSETVQWVVMKERVTVPGAYLKQLRKLKGSEGNAIAYNFRTTQDVAGRTVTTPSSPPIKH